MIQSSEMKETEQSSEDSESRNTGTFMWWIVGAFLIYLTPFVLVLLDELILGTFWISDILPGSLKATFRAIYPFFHHFSPY